MECIFNLIRNIYNLYTRYKLFVLSLFSIFSFYIGFEIIGPFFDSDVYRWFKSIADDYPVISELISVQDLLFDKIIASTIPLFTVWSVILSAYCLYPERIIEINNSSRYLVILSGSTALIILMIGFIAVGTCIYGYYNYGYSHLFLISIFSSIMVIACGVFIRKGTRLIINERAGVNRFAFPVLIVCLTLGIGAYIYGLLSDPFQYWRVVHEAYEIANK
jgi:hypothetical protein